MIAPVFFYLLVGLLGLVNGQISAYVTPAERSALFKKANDVVSSPKCLKGAFYAVQTLKSAGNAISCNCNELQSLLSVATSAYDLYYAKSVEESCMCTFNFGTDPNAMIKKELQADNLKSIVGGVLAGTSFNALSSDERAQAVGRVLGFMHSDGTFKMNLSDEVGTVSNVHLALEMLAAVGERADSDVAMDVFEKAFSMLPGGEFGGETDATLMVPLSKLTDKKLRLVGDRLLSVAEVLLDKKYSNCMSTLSKVYDALTLVSQYKASPVHISFEQSRFDAGQKQNHKLVLSVKSILGADAELESAEAVSIKTVGKDNTVMKGEAFVGKVLDMSSAELTAGRYLAQISVTIAGRKAQTHQAYFVVSDRVTVKDVRFLVMEGGEEDTSVEAQKVSTQNSLSGVSASAMAGDKIQVSFVVAAQTGDSTPRKPHQAVVRVTHQNTGISTFFVAKRGDSSGGLAYTAAVFVGDLMDKVDRVSGPFTVSILVGDAAYSAPVEFVLGSVDLRFPVKQVDNLPLYAKSLLHTSDTTLKALPEITHVMRPPAKRASNLMATVFTGLTVAPLVVFVLFMLSLRPDLSRIGSVSSLLALACFSLLLSLYVGYWLSLQGVSFYETIKYLFILGPVTMLVGSFSLASVKAMRVRQAEANAGKEKKGN